MLTVRQQFAMHQQERGISMAAMGRKVGVTRKAIFNLLVVRADHASVPRTLSDLMDAYEYEVAVVPPDHSLATPFI